MTSPGLHARPARQSHRTLDYRSRDRLSPPHITSHTIFAAIYAYISWLSTPSICTLPSLSSTGYQTCLTTSLLARRWRGRYFAGWSHMYHYTLRQTGTGRYKARCRRALTQTSAGCFGFSLGTGGWFSRVCLRSVAHAFACRLRGWLGFYSGGCTCSYVVSRLPLLRAFHVRLVVSASFVAVLAYDHSREVMHVMSLF